LLGIKAPEYGLKAHGLIYCRGESAKRRGEDSRYQPTGEGIKGIKVKPRTATEGERIGGAGEAARLKLSRGR
jgi:hypothetical protein